MGEVGHLPSSEQPHRALSTTLSSPFLQFLGNLIQKGNAKRIYTTVLIENGLYLDALLDTGSEICLMCTDTFAEVTHLMQSTGRRLQVEAYDINITSYTQDKAPISLAGIHIPGDEDGTPHVHLHGQRRTIVDWPGPVGQTRPSD